MKTLFFVFTKENLPGMVGNVASTEREELKKIHINKEIGLEKLTG